MQARANKMLWQSQHYGGCHAVAIDLAEVIFGQNRFRSGLHYQLSGLLDTARPGM